MTRSDEIIQRIGHIEALEKRLKTVRQDCLDLAEEYAQNLIDGLPTDYSWGILRDSHNEKTILMEALNLLRIDLSRLRQEFEKGTDND